MQFFLVTLVSAVIGAILWTYLIEKYKPVPRRIKAHVFRRLGYEACAFAVLVMVVVVFTGQFPLSPQLFGVTAALGLESLLVAYGFFNSRFAKKWLHPAFRRLGDS